MKADLCINIYRDRLNQTVNASWLQHPNGICLKQLSEINGIYKQIYIYLGNPPPYLSTKSLK